MRRLLKYLKPYTLLILLSIVLLFVLANANLALPEYLSKIVNVGIQQGGVENAVPEAIRESQMDKLVIFVSEEDQALVLDSYELVEPGSPEAELYIEDYPALADEPVYVLQDVDQATMDELNTIMGQAWVVVSGIEQMMADPSQAPPMGEDLAFDPSMIPEGVDIFTLLAQMPAAQRAQMSERITEAFAALGEGMVSQMAIVAVKAEYEALGMDTARLQSGYILRTGGIMLLISLIGGVATIAVGFLAARTAAGAARDIRKATFAKVESFSGAEFNEFSTASLITRSTNDVTQVQQVIFMFMRMVLFAPILGIGAIIRAMETGANMWWIIALAVAALLSLIAIVFSR